MCLVCHLIKGWSTRQPQQTGYISVEICRVTGWKLLRGTFNPGHLPHSAAWWGSHRYWSTDVHAELCKVPPDTSTSSSKGCIILRNSSSCSSPWICLLGTSTRSKVVVTSHSLFTPPRYHTQYEVKVELHRVDSDLGGLEAPGRSGEGESLVPTPNTGSLAGGERSASVSTRGTRRPAFHLSYSQAATHNMSLC